jgi:alpha-beta hydrolase superfamily lysophospholipase
VPTGTPVSGPAGRRRHRWRAWAIGVGIAIAVLVLVFYLGAGWYFSSQLSERAFDPAERRAAGTPAFDYRVVDVGSGFITLAVPEDPGSLLTPEVFGLQWADGYGRLGAIQSSTSDRVTREFELLTGTMVDPGDAVGLDSKAFPQNPQVGLGIPFQDVTYQGELGSYPAWYVEGSGSTWAILVHGNGMTRADTLRIMPVLQQHGYPMLAIAIRNDAGAPADPSGMVRYGLTEWKDLEAAVRYALDKGAERMVLVGYSMGGGIVANFLYQSELSQRVDGVILDSPMLDFSTTVDLNAAREELPLIGVGMPQSLTNVAKWMAGWRYDVDWKGLDYLAGAKNLAAPILLIHGTADTDVPPQTSAELASLRPDLVTYVPVEGARHMESWNVDLDAYETQVTDFLAGIGG